MKEKDIVRMAVLETLVYEIVLSPGPTNAAWAWSAIGALRDAELLEKEEIDAVFREFVRIRSEEHAAARKPPQPL